ncbi:MAG: hypothetical protein U5L72_10360 [Bacteroidales bacterium]|nr:hypothetical protein [Bacteroidales bacterium]
MSDATSNRLVRRSVFLSNSMVISPLSLFVVDGDATDPGEGAYQHLDNRGDLMLNHPGGGVRPCIAYCQ